MKSLWQKGRRSMKCLSCDSENFKEEIIEFTPENFGGFTYQTPAFVCQSCGTLLMDTEQMDIALKKILEKFADGAVTKEEILFGRKEYTPRL